MTNKSPAYVILAFAIAIVLTGCAPQANAQDDGLAELMALDEWDLLWISDSSGWGVAEIYAGYIEADTGIPVNVHDSWSGGLSAGTILDILEGNHTPDFRLAQIPELIPEMEVIVFYANPEESVDENNPGDWNCGQAASETYVRACEMDTFAVYVQDLEAVYQRILELRGDQPTILRAFDAYNPTLARWEVDGAFEACQACWGNYNAAIHQAAEKYHIPVAGVYDAWNGVEHDEDPNDKGYTKDGIHPNVSGAEVIAGELRKLGYDPVAP